jgi:hypothetical protein
MYVFLCSINSNKKHIILYIFSDSSVDWKKMALIRLKLEWAMSPSLFQGRKIKNFLIIESNPEKQYNFGCYIEQAYKVYFSYI